LRLLSAFAFPLFLTFCLRSSAFSFLFPLSGLDVFPAFFKSNETKIVVGSHFHRCTQHLKKIQDATELQGDQMGPML
jgi:hypothetical protein